MIKSFLMAMSALAMLSGVAVAQMSSSSSTSTQSTTSVAPVPGVTSESSSQRTVDSTGVVTDRTQTYTSGTTVSPLGDTATTRKTTETTTVR